MEPFLRSVERDYAKVRYLLGHAAFAPVPAAEQRMLEWDYAILRLWFFLVRRSSSSAARKTLNEMCGIVRYLAARAEGRTGSYSRA